MVGNLFDGDISSAWEAGSTCNWCNASNLCGVIVRAARVVCSMQCVLYAACSTCSAQSACSMKHAVRAVVRAVRAVVRVMRAVRTVSIVRAMPSDPYPLIEVECRRSSVGVAHMHSLDRARTPPPPPLPRRHRASIRYCVAPQWLARSARAAVQQCRTAEARG